MAQGDRDPSYSITHHILQQFDKCLRHTCGHAAAASMAVSARLMCCEQPAAAGLHGNEVDGILVHVWCFTSGSTRHVYIQLDGALQCWSSADKMHTDSTAAAALLSGQ
jgi:hypothetical protein